MSLHLHLKLKFIKMLRSHIFLKITALEYHQKPCGPRVPLVQWGDDPAARKLEIYPCDN